MPNYEIIHDQVGPFTRTVEGSLLPRIVTRAMIDATGPEVLPAKPGEKSVRPYEGNLKLWLRNGAIAPTEANVTPESVPPSILNNPTVATSPEGQKAAAVATQNVTPVTPVGTRAATQPVK